VFLFLANFRNLANVIPENGRKDQKIVIFRDFLYIKQSSFPGIVSVVR
jgi:hypothetical protein